MSGEKRWYEDRIAVAAFVLSCLSFFWGAFVFYSARQDQRITRSITEVDRVFDQAFTAGVSKLLAAHYRFVTDPVAISLPPKERFEAFWRQADADAEMLQLAFRVSSIEGCVTRDRCDVEEVFSRFPDVLYQILFRLRDVLVLDDELERHESEKDLVGWWLDEDLVAFFTDYCLWAQANYGEINYWNPEFERWRLAPGQTLPDPCQLADAP